MAWHFSTRASVATVLTMHPCISQCLGVKCVVIEHYVLPFFQVDEYPVKNLSFPLDASADTKLDNPTYIYFGRNCKYLNLMA